MYPLSTDLLAGQTLASKYQIRRVIGRGGVGIVYLATEIESGRDVVLKCLAEHWLDDPEAVARFEREARRLDSLRHPNIVSMLGFERDQGRAFLVMEHVRGRPLSEYITHRGFLTFEEFVPIAAQILKGMGYAHSREMMIRDVKPSNIMLCERKGRTNFVKILDFGLAKFLRGETQITEEHVIGTVGYLAPETLKGEPGDLRVDVYAVGVLFYYMLSGHLPFEGANDATIFYKTVNEAPVHLSERLPLGHGVPEALVALIHSCLAKDPKGRPSDANIVVEQLIDAVPSPLFRLPRIGEVVADATTGSMAGNTGLISLLGADPRLKETSPLSTSNTSATTPQKRSGLKFAVLGTTSALLLVAGGALLMKVISQTSAVAASNVPPQSVLVPSAVIPEPAPASPPPTTTAPSTDIVHDGQLPPTTAPPTSPPADPALTGVVLFDSYPVAELIIDGEPHGRTPYRGKLSVGTHRVRMDARGYESWSSTYEVTANDNEPISVRLLEKAPAPRSTRVVRASEPRAEPSPARAPDLPPPPPTADAGRAPPTPSARDEAPTEGQSLMSKRDEAGRDRVFLSRDGADPSDDAFLRSR